MFDSTDHLGSHLEPGTARFEVGGISVQLCSSADLDDDALYALFIACHDDWNELTEGWDAQLRERVLRMQYKAQQQEYEASFPDARYLVVLADEEPIGCLALTPLASELRIIDIGLVPSHRNQGIGSALLKFLLDSEPSHGKPVTLHVQQGNPAQRLYERLGFRDIGSVGLFRLMEFRACIANSD